jgi:hypothetical protein
MYHNSAVLRETLFIQQGVQKSPFGVSFITVSFSKIHLAVPTQRPFIGTLKKLADIPATGL